MSLCILNRNPLKSMNFKKRKKEKKKHPGNSKVIKGL